MTISRGGDYRYDKPTSIGEPDKVTSWPFKEPEKTTAWKSTDIEPPKDTPIVLRDSEADKAAKRTRLIKERMSPPGALNLPAKLEAARWEWGIPDGAFRARAIFDRIHVFPIDLFTLGGKLPGSTLWAPEATQKRGLQNGHRGILISMGLAAADQCISHGCELGNIVRTIRNAPHAEECERLEGEPMYYLVLRAGDLTGDETLEQELRSGAKQIVENGGEHSYCFDLEGRKKRIALTRENW